MTNWQALIGVAAGFVFILGLLPYLVTIWQGKTRPNRASWWIWTVVSFNLVASYFSSGASNTIWLPICTAICHLIIAIISLKFGGGGWNRFDRVCLFGAGISLLLWRQFNSPLVALLMNILIDFLGSLPTMRKSYYEPQTEAPLPWIIFLVASFFNVIAIETWSVAIAIYPIYYFCSTATIVILIIRPKMTFKTKKYNRPRRIKRTI